MDLFEQRKQELIKKSAPLADRMRPRTLDEYIGQSHIIGEGRLLRRAIQIDQLSSVIFYGPPGTGKTTLARIIANTTKAYFISINAVLAGVKDIREAIESAQKTLELYGRRTILFVDEVHRFNKSQQDALLPHVENGILILIGATTENPYFEVNKALVSRSRIFQLNTLDEEDLKAIAMQAINDKERGYGSKNITVDPEAMDHLVKVANGDARGVLNALELAVETTPVDINGVIRINRSIAEESIQQRAVLYDKDGDVHYDTISAFIKSMRGSDPDAALYWMSKMIYAGEDPRFIFRRMLILACEDIGMADPKALGVVIDAARAFDYVGLPEGRYHLAHACLYLSTAPKSNSSMAFFDALNIVSKEAADDVPNHLRDGNRDKEGFGHGEGYLYPHAYRDHWVAQQYLPSVLQGKVFYQPSDQGYEKGISEKVTRMREAQVEAMVDNSEENPLLLLGNKRTSDKDMWVERTLGDQGISLDNVRDKILEIGELKKDNLVLDLNARTGLLTFATARIVKDGSVWAIAHDDKSFITLQGMASKLDVLSRPQIVKSNWEYFDLELKKAAGAKVLFDTIMGRNILMHVKNKTDLVKRTIPFMAKDGRMILSEMVPSDGQRISKINILPLSGQSFEKILSDAENDIFFNPDDPMVNWTIETLVNGLNTISGISVHQLVDEQISHKRILLKDIDYWFRNDDVKNRKSLGQKILERSDEETVKAIQKFLCTHLVNRTVEWKTRIVYLLIKKKNKKAS
jgi:putative ATPase